MGFHKIMKHHIDAALGLAKFDTPEVWRFARLS